MHFIDSKTILTSGSRMNIYRGCQHGCIYCDSRSDCYRMTDKPQYPFEDIEVKRNAPELLDDALRRKRKPCMIGTGSMCDPYMPCEEQLGLTRRCLEIIYRRGCGATLITKSDSVMRDLELLKHINSATKCVVQMTLTTYNEELCRIIEPGVCTTSERFKTLQILRDNGIPTVVWLSPLLPFINDTEENLRGILDYCFRAGVRGILCYGIGLTLRSGNREYFYKALDRSFPGVKEMYIKKFGYSYECMSDNSPRLMRIFHESCEKHGVMHDNDKIFAYLSELPNNDTQLSLI